MNHTPWVTAIVGMILFSNAVPRGAAAAEVNDYASRIAAAQALAAEGSHAGARAIYREALTLVADPEQRRWIQLSILGEELAEDRSRRDAPRIRTELAQLLNRDEKSEVVRDRFWAAARSVEAETYWPSSSERLAIHFDVAAFWAAQPPAPENEQAFVSASALLGQSLATGDFDRATTPVADAIDLLRQATSLTPLPAGREKLVLLFARALQQQRRSTKMAPALVTTAYEAALVAIRGTPHHTEALLRRAQWATNLGPLARPSWRDPDLSSGGKVGEISAAEFTRVLVPINDALTAAANLSSSDRELRAIAAQLTRRRDELTQPSLQLDLAPAYLPDSRFSFGLTAQHVDEIAFDLHQVSLDVFRAVMSEKPTGAGPAALARAKPFLTWSLPTGLGSELGLVRTQLGRPESLPPGAYVLVARSTGLRSAAPAVRWFLVTKAQALAQSGSLRTVEVHAFEQETGKLLPNVRGRIWGEQESASIAPVGAGHGRSVLSGSIKRYTPLTILGEADGQPFLIPSFHAAWPETDDQWLIHLLADRPLYRPGETAQWKITLRHRLKGELQAPSGTRLKVTAKIRDLPIGTWDLKLNALGSASGNLAIPALAAPGQVFFEVESEGNDGAERIAAFVVDNFRPPETWLTLTPLDADQIRRAQPGGEVALKVAARYFSGEPLANATIAVGVQFAPRPTWFDVPRENQSSERQIPNPINLSVVTDSRGDAVVRVPLPVDLPRRTHLDIAAALTGAGTTSATKFAFDLLPAGYTAEIGSAAQLAPTPPSPFFNGGNIAEPRPLYTAPDQPVTLAVFTRDGRDLPVAANGHLAVSKKTWEEIWRAPDGQLFSGESLRERQRGVAVWPPRDTPLTGGWELVRAGYRSEAQGVIEFATDATGRASVQLPPAGAGYYEILYEPETAAPDGRPLARADLFVADSTTPLLGYHAQAAQVIPFADRQEPGKPIRALVVLPVTGRNAVVRISGMDGGETRTEFFEGNARILEFPWKSSYASGARIDVSVLAIDSRDGGATLKVSRDAHQANVTLLPETERSRPGDKVRLRVQTTDAAGRPLSSEVALSVADAAVASLLPPSHRSLAETFLAPGQIPYLSSGRSQRAAFFGREKSPPKRPAANGTDEVSDGDVVLLTPFEVSTNGDRGYAAGSTLAGSRFQAGGADGMVPDVRVRSSFSYTAFWIPDVKTDRKGEATVEFTYPDNLTKWQVKAEAIAEGHRFGDGQTSTETSLPLQARLRTPRTLVAGDSATLLGAILNQTPTPVNARAELNLTDSSSLELTSPSLQTGTVAAEGETVLGWTARAKAVGKSTVRFTALAGGISDAMEVKLPVKEDGFYQSSGVTGRATDHPLRVNLVLPTPFDPARTTVELQISPGITPSLVQGLPYLIDYPYGCIEQTVSRFLPAAVVAKLLRDLGFNAAEVEKSILPATLPAPPGRKSGLGLGKLDAVIEQSLAGLQAAQQNGSFGWFPEGEADTYMTAYVLRGLNVAAKAGIALPAGLHLGTYEAVLDVLAQNDPELTPQKLAWILAAATGFPEEPDAKQRELLQRSFAQLYAQRSTLGPAGLALLAQSAHSLRRDQESGVLRRNLNDGVTRATTAEFGKTAHWGKFSNYFDGLDGAVESTALCLQALLALDPKDETVDAAAAWLLLNRQSGRWNNTRDTALALLALSDYARARGETSARGGYRLTLNGRVLAEKRFDRTSVLAPITLQVAATALQAGGNQILLERTGGDSPCYLIATARSWAQAESTIAAGSYLKVSREFVRIAEKDTVIGIPLSESQLLPADGAVVFNHERVECRLTLEVPHDLDYVILESPKPGGCEPINALSGWDASLRRSGTEVGNNSADRATPGHPIYREEHDDQSVFFLSHLPAGRWEIRYTMRALFAGDFRALPATAAAIYVPVIAANTDARRIQIKGSSAP
ncbi:MAG: alpha-2-macroglobulin family protein [Opitutaceae bacterium]